MNRRTILLAFCFARLICAGAAKAQAAESWSGERSRIFVSAELATKLDADRQTDWIRAYPCIGPAGSTSYCVRVAVSETHSSQTIVLATNAARVRIASHDVDGDHLADVLVMNAADGSPLGVWINDGYGGFKRSDVGLYPASIWHEDPFLCQASPRVRPSLEFIDGCGDFYLAPSASTAGLLCVARSFRPLDVAPSRPSEWSSHSGRAPPAL